MIFEYALEPSLLADWNRFQRLVALFGMTKGRLISRYPRNWSRRVYDAAPSGTTEKTKIEIALQRIQGDLLLPRKHIWDEKLDWLRNAVAEHGRSPFQAILAGCTHSYAVVVDATDLDATDLPQLLRHGPSQIHTRNAQELGRAVRPLLLLSKKVLIIEPNFTIKSPKFRGPLEAILMATLDLDNHVRRDIEVEIHVGMDKLDEYLDKAASLNAFLQPHVPETMTLTVVGWHKEDLHNRYLITDRVGISIGEGIGLPDARSSRTDDVLAPLDATTAGTLMRRYCDMSRRVLSHRISGQKRLTS